METEKDSDYTKEMTTTVDREEEDNHVISPLLQKSEVKTERKSKKMWILVVAILMVVGGLIFVIVNVKPQYPYTIECSQETILLDMSRKAPYNGQTVTFYIPETTNLNYKVYSDFSETELLIHDVEGEIDDYSYGDINVTIFPIKTADKKGSITFVVYNRDTGEIRGKKSIPVEIN